jgi:hypothetical protein
MTQQNPEQKSQQFQNLNDESLEKLKGLVKDKHLETARKLRDERVNAYIAKGIQEASQEWQRETKDMFQGILDNINDQHANLVVEAEANLPEVEGDVNLDLQLPSLEESVSEKKSKYGVLKPSDDGSDLSDDLKDVFEN